MERDKASDSHEYTYDLGMLQLRGVSLWRPQQSKSVIDGLNLSFRAGHVTAICGPNGSGKSSLVSCLADLNDDDLCVLGERLWVQRSGELSTVHEKSLLLRQRQPFVPTDRVENFFGFYRDRSGFDSRRFARLCESFDVVHLTTSLLGQLSEGEWKRVQCACYFAMNVPFRLLDEPEASLDGYGILKLGNEIRQCARRGEIVVLASHSLSFVKSTADWVAYLNDGNLTWSSPTNEFVALGQASRMGA